MRGAASAAAAPKPAFSRSRLRIAVSSLCDPFGGNVARQRAEFRPQILCHQRHLGEEDY
jgi:hypothetical protein